MLLQLCVWSNGYDPGGDPGMVVRAHLHYVYCQKLPKLLGGWLRSSHPLKSGTKHHGRQRRLYRAASASGTERLPYGKMRTVVSVIDQTFLWRSSTLSTHNASLVLAV